MEIKQVMTASEFRQLMTEKPHLLVSKKRNVGMSFIPPVAEKPITIQNNHSTIKTWYEIGGKNYFYKSTWEINYALILQFYKNAGLIKDWSYESKEFWFVGIKRGVCSYKTDFKVDNLDDSHEWHEVKGYMDSKSKTKLKRMAKYFPNEKVVLIEKKQLEALKKQIPAPYVSKSNFSKN